MPRVSELTRMREELAEMRELLARSLGTSRREILTANAQADHLKEHPDPTPMEAPVGYDAPPTLTELVQQHVEGAMSEWAHEHKLGTFEEEDDFEPEDEDLFPLSGYEVTEYEMEDEADPALEEPSTAKDSETTEPAPAAPAAEPPPEPATPPSV